MTKALEILVIGAGFAGLSAGQALRTAQNVRVTLLEASQRVGGRAHTAEVLNLQRQH